MFGKPVDLSSLPLPPGAQHPTQQQSASSAPNGNGNGDDDEGPVKRGFAYLKRDLVRLLGILCSGDSAVQDRVRLCGGIPVVMNLCVVDDRNPCTSPIPIPHPIPRILFASIVIYPGMFP